MYNRRFAGRCAPEETQEGLVAACSEKRPRPQGGIAPDEHHPCKLVRLPAVLRHRLPLGDPAGGRLHRGRLPQVLPLPGAAPLGAGLRHGPAGGRTGRARLSRDGPGPQPAVARLPAAAAGAARLRRDRAAGRHGRLPPRPRRSTPPTTRSTASATCSTRSRPGGIWSASPTACAPAASISSASTSCRPTPPRSASNAGPSSTAARR